MKIEAFLDTNILLYAYDLDAGDKRMLAQELIHEALLHPGSFAISIQVLQEFHVNLIRSGVGLEEASELLKDFNNWKIVENTLSLFQLGLGIQSRYQVSLWDAMIVAAAHVSGAANLFTEDLNHGQDFGGVRIVNPFRKIG